MLSDGGSTPPTSTMLQRRAGDREVPGFFVCAPRCRPLSNMSKAGHVRLLCVKTHGVACGGFTMLRGIHLLTDE